ncbi:MAG: GGDEF domain-containing protein [Lachnospiraceae bacterium]|nr:GGDEF domain-containing protein [Lachnospiraceae bacterium]
MLEKFLYGHQDDSQTNYDAMRYSLILNGIAIVHLVFMILFYVMNVYFMGIYNTVVVILYFYLARVISDVKDLSRLYWIVLGEVVLHSCLATLFVGWNFGFMYYLSSLIPTSFYLAFSIKAFRRKLTFPFITAGVTFFSYMAILTLAHFVSPFYPDTAAGFRVFLTYMNIIIGLSVTFLFSALFAVEVNSMQLRMENEQERLEDEASYDPLTHFLNRRSMDERLNHTHRNAIINDIPYSLIMADIDHFKIFNDSYGHDCGDFVLQNISKIITAQIRSKDSACRWGGEEFLILVNDGPEIAVDVAERIRTAIEAFEFNYEGKALHVTITLGVSGYYSSAKVKTLIEIADKRLYKGKEGGRNCVVSS